MTETGREGVDLEELNQTWKQETIIKLEREIKGASTYIREHRKENRIYPEGVWARDSSEIKCCLQAGSHKLSPQRCSTLRFDNSVMHTQHTAIWCVTVL